MSAAEHLASTPGTPAKPYFDHVNNARVHHCNCFVLLVPCASLTMRYKPSLQKYSACMESTPFQGSQFMESCPRLAVGARAFSSLSGPLVARMLSFCSSCTSRPQKRLNVRGSRTCGLICTCTSPCVPADSPVTATCSQAGSHVMWRARTGVHDKDRRTRAPAHSAWCAHTTPVPRKVCEQLPCKPYQKITHDELDKTSIL